MRKTALALGLTAIALTGCVNSSDRVRDTQRTQGVSDIEYSLERENISKRIDITNDQNQVMFWYGLSGMGNIVAKAVVKGKVTSSEKRLEPRTTDDDYPTRGYVGDEMYRTNEIMGADKTYGNSDKYVFWFTPEEQYFQWNGLYILSNAPLRLEDPVINFSDIDYEEMQRAETAREALKGGKSVNNNLEVIQQ